MDEYLKKVDVLKLISKFTNAREPVSVDTTIWSIISEVAKLQPESVKPVIYGYWVNGTYDKHGNLIAETEVPWDDMNPNCPATSCYCVICGQWLTASDEYPAIGIYCPHCGACMKYDIKQKES